MSHIYKRVCECVYVCVLYVCVVCVCVCVPGARARRSPPRDVSWPPFGPQRSTLSTLLYHICSAPPIHREKVKNKNKIKFSKASALVDLVQKVTMQSTHQNILPQSYVHVMHNIYICICI
jgi:hypothetical protein